NIPNPRPSAQCIRSFLLRIRSLLDRLFAVAQRCLFGGLSGSDLLELLALLAQSRCRLFFACTDEVEVQGCGLGRTLGPTRHPSLGLGYIVSRQQPVCWSATRVPLHCALKVAGVLAQPNEIGVQSLDQLREAAAPAGTRCCLGVIVKIGVVEIAQV